MAKITLHPDSLNTWYAENLEYLRYEYDLEPEDTCIDVGAFEGDWGRRMQQKYGCHIIAVEPGPEIAAFTTGYVINKAAATHEGVINMGGDRFARSIFESGHDVSCFDINTLLQGPIAVLKLNVEGSEYELLDHIISAGLHKNILHIQVQFHQIEGVPYEMWYEQIAKQLSQTHELSWRWPYCWENWRLK